MIIFSLVFLFFIGTVFSSGGSSEGGINSYGEYYVQQGSSNLQQPSQPYNYHPSAPYYSWIWVDSALQSYFSEQFPKNNYYTKANIDQLIAWSRAQKELEILQSVGYDVVQLSSVINQISPSEFDQNKFFSDVADIKKKGPANKWSWSDNLNDGLVRIAKHSSFVNPGKGLFSIGLGAFLLDIGLASCWIPVVLVADGIRDGLFVHADQKDKNACSCHKHKKPFFCAYLWLRVFVVPITLTLMYYKLRAR